MRSPSRTRWPAHRDDQGPRARALMLSREDGLDVHPIDRGQKRGERHGIRAGERLNYRPARPLSRIS